MLGEAVSPTRSRPLAVPRRHASLFPSWMHRDAGSTRNHQQAAWDQPVDNQFRSGLGYPSAPPLTPPSRQVAGWGRCSLWDS